VTSCNLIGRYFSITLDIQMIPSVQFLNYVFVKIQYIHHTSPALFVLFVYSILYVTMLLVTRLYSIRL
jgi:hypothetical protein